MKGLVVQWEPVREPVREPGRRSCCRDVGQAQGGLWGTALMCRRGGRCVLGTPQPRERDERDSGLSGTRGRPGETQDPWAEGKVYS